MKDPDRLFDHCDDEFVRALLAEGRRPVENRQRTLAVLAAVGVGGTLASKSAWAAAATWKNSLAALLVVGSGVATYQWVASGTEPSVVPQPQVRAPGVRSAVGATPEVSLTPLVQRSEDERGTEPEQAPGLHGDAESRVQQTGELPTTSTNSDSGKAGVRRSLSLEVSLLDRARASLRAGRPQQALAVLEKYSAQHPNGALQREAELVRIPALFQAGMRREASSRARRVLAKNPSALVADQLRAYVSP
jgi:hypothetical protein